MRMMRLINFLYIVWLGIRERWSRVLLTSFALAFAVAVTLTAFSLGFGFIRRAVAQAEEMFPRSILTVRPKTLDIAAFRFNATTLDDATVEKLSRFDGVEFVAPQLSLKMPLRAEGDIMGQSATSDVVVVGIGPRLVERDVEPGFSFHYDEATSLPIPCIVPRFFLDMYNLAYADSLGLPKISEHYPIGKEFSLVLGETYLFGPARGKALTLPCRIVGITRQTGLMVGVLIPLGHAKALNAWYQERQSVQYNAAHLKLKDLSKYDEITSTVRAMGYTIESQGEALDKFLFVARLAAVSVCVFTFLVAAVVAIAIFNVYSLALLLRQAELLVLRAVGATRRFLTAMLLADAAIVGAGGGLIGGGAASLMIRSIEHALTVIAAKLSFIPATLSSSIVATVFSGLGMGMILAVVITAPIVWLRVQKSATNQVSEL